MINLFLSSLGTKKAESPPPSDGGLSAQVAGHRYDAQMTYTQTTDILLTYRHACEFWAFRYNITPTAFISPYHQTDHDLLKFGRVKPSVYFATDRWQRWKDHLRDTIPDYEATVWSAKGAEYFANAVEGQPKPARYPNFGQQMWDMTNGQLGYDVATGQTGTYGLKELEGIAAVSQDFVLSNYGVKPYCFSYRNGRNDTPQAYVPLHIGGRNSDSSISGPAYTSYGQGYGYPGEAIDRVLQVNRPSAMRYRDFFNNLGGGTQAQADAYLTQQLQATLQNKGWFEDFTHWHTAGVATRDMYAKTREVLAGADVHYADYEEAMRYLWCRESVQSVTVSGNTVSIQWKAFDIPAALTVPVSVKINTAGTSLQGKDITSSVGGVLRKSANVFVVEVPYNTPAFTISETASPVYVDLSSPVISYRVSGTTLTVTTDKPCRAAIWKAGNGTQEVNLTAPVRSVAWGTQHAFTVSETEQQEDVYIGALSGRDQSAVLGPVDFTKT